GNGCACRRGARRRDARAFRPVHRQVGAEDERKQTTRRSRRAAAAAGTDDPAGGAHLRRCRHLDARKKKSAVQARGGAHSTRARKGPWSTRVTVPLVPPPPPPGQPTLTYNEQAITIEWPPVANGAVQEEAPADDDVVPSTTIGQ